MTVWTSFMDLVHLIGALGCLVLTGGFAADGEPARAVFYGLLTMAFAVALAHRRARPRVLDLRETPADRAAPLGRTTGSR
ncbi:hypothetical protein FHR75_001369 [Kineococcus radiotolerans]|uniref:Uncharacterized protein n=1 Tax=Kineococcus radiotolerans TaxID=131568 RepID=A0A7W4TLM9_KINRA|nr:hypothetical protein [Kineococcus radiotolerans]MBB2900581.1 hypothetical protein [Kineococcus radiotolerans]